MTQTHPLRPARQWPVYYNLPTSTHGHPASITTARTRRHLDAWSPFASSSALQLWPRRPRSPTSDNYVLFPPPPPVLAAFHQEYLMAGTPAGLRALWSFAPPPPPTWGCGGPAHSNYTLCSHLREHIRTLPRTALGYVTLHRLGPLTPPPLTPGRSTPTRCPRRPSSRPWSSLRSA